MKSTQALKSLQYYTRIILCSILILSIQHSSAQNTFFSFQIARDITGSGLGGNVCPAISVSHNKSTFSIGPNFQRKEMNFSGIQTNYNYTAASNYNHKFELCFSGNLTLHTSAHMSRGIIEIEKASHPEGKINYEAMRLQVIEGYGGIGLKFNATRNLSTGFSAGMGMFSTLNKNYDREMYREKASVALQIRFIVFYSFKKTNTF